MDNNYYFESQSRFGQGSFFDRFIRYITESFSTPFELEEVSQLQKFTLFLFLLCVFLPSHYRIIIMCQPLMMLHTPEFFCRIPHKIENDIRCYLLSPPPPPLQLVDFFARYPDAGSATRGYRQAIEAIEGNIQWLANSQDLQTCLDNTEACFNP